MPDAALTSAHEPVQPGPGRLQRAIFRVIFENDTARGRAFDVALLVVIVASVVVAAMETVAGVRERFGSQLRQAEWVFAGLFAIEYTLRLGCVRRPLRYAGSFYGVVDLLALLPSLLTLAIGADTRALNVVRGLRLLRVFSILRLTHFVSEGDQLRAALVRARAKIVVFLLTVTIVVTIVGALMYVIEGPANGFTSVPLGIYWAIVTMTTVGFGDVVPRTTLGKIVASALIILGYSMIVVPTGFVTASFVREDRAARRAGPPCPRCGLGGHDGDARYCKRCGELLSRVTT